MGVCWWSSEAGGHGHCGDGSVRGALLQKTGEKRLGFALLLEVRECCSAQLCTEMTEVVLSSIPNFRAVEWEAMGQRGREVKGGRREWGASLECDMVKTFKVFNACRNLCAS